MGAESMNELTTDIQFNVDLVPSVIEIKNEDQLASLIKRTTDHYKDLVFTEKNIDEAKKARADLNKVTALIDEQRKLVKKSYNEPLNAFESKIKEYINQIKEVSQTIDEAIKNQESLDKEQRLIKIEELIQEMAPNYRVDPSAVAVDSKWLNKTSFTTKGEVSKKIVEEIATRMLEVYSEQEKEREKKDGLVIISSYCKACNINPENFLFKIEQGAKASAVMKEIDEMVHSINEQEKQKQEEQRQLFTDQVASNSKTEEPVVDFETGEIMIFGSKILESVTLKLSGTETQLNLLNRYIVDNKIKVEVIE